MCGLGIMRPTLYRSTELTQLHTRVTCFAHHKKVQFSICGVCIWHDETCLCFAHHKTRSEKVQLWSVCGMWHELMTYDSWRNKVVEKCCFPRVLARSKVANFEKTNGEGTYAPQPETCGYQPTVTQILTHVFKMHSAGIEPALLRTRALSVRLNHSAKSAIFMSRVNESIRKTFNIFFMNSRTRPPRNYE